MTTEEKKRLDDISAEAERVMWEAVRQYVPSVYTNEIDPNVAILIQTTIKAAIADWLKRNERDAWTEVGSVITIEFIDKPFPNCDPKEVAFVWTSDFNTFRSQVHLRMSNWGVRDYAGGLRDAGTRIAKYDKDRPGWYMPSIQGARYYFTVEHHDDASYMSAFVKDGKTVVSEIVTNIEPIMAAVPYSKEHHELIERLVAEINMIKFELGR